MSWIGTITNAGTALLSQLPGGLHTLTLTRASIGTGTVPDISLKTQTTITGEKTDVSIKDRKSITDGIKLQIRVDPATALVGAYTGKQIGVWGKLDNGAETLIVITQSSTGIDVPLASVNPEFLFDLFIPIATSNEESIVVTCDTSVFVSAADLEAYEPVVEVDFGTVSSLPVTVSDAAITAAMTVVGFDIADEEAFSTTPEVTISAGSAVLSGTLETGASTKVIVYLAQTASAS